MTGDSKHFKRWPCGTEVGNPWHHSCRDKRCKAASKASGEPIGVGCIVVRPGKARKSKE